MGLENLGWVEKSARSGMANPEDGTEKPARSGIYAESEVTTGKSEIGRRNLWLRHRNNRMGGESGLEVEILVGPGDRLRMCS